MFKVTMGDWTGRPVRTITMEAMDAESAKVDVYADPRAEGLLVLTVEGDAPDAKPCGCRPDRLTRAVTLWHCSACGETQGARKRRCVGCKRARPAAPAEREYLSPEGSRGSFTDRRGVTRCVGCLAPE